MADEQTSDGAFGTYLRAQRQVARLSLRQLSELTQISNPYLSQIERGLHQPSVQVIKSLARALGVSVESLLAQAAGVVGGRGPAETRATEDAIRRDPRLDDTQREALLAVYRSMVATSPAPAPAAEVADDVDDVDDEDIDDIAEPAPTPATQRPRPRTSPNPPDTGPTSER